MTSLPDAGVRRWRAWRGAANASRRDVVSISLLVPIAHLGVAAAGYARVARWSGVIAGRAERDRADAWTQRGAEAVRRLRAHGVMRGNCLSRALALQRWLGRRGVATEIRFGVRPDGRTIAAHAWLEYRGAPLTDVTEIGEQFAPLGR